MTFSAHSMEIIESFLSTCEQSYKPSGHMEYLYKRDYDYYNGTRVTDSTLLSDMVGFDDERNCISTHIDLLMKNASIDVMESCGKPVTPRNFTFIIHGSSKTGKRSFIRALADHYKINMFISDEDAFKAKKAKKAPRPISKVPCIVLVNIYEEDLIPYLDMVSVVPPRNIIYIFSVNRKITNPSVYKCDGIFRSPRFAQEHIKMLAEKIFNMNKDQSVTLAQAIYDTEHKRFDLFTKISAYYKLRPYYEDPNPLRYFDPLVCSDVSAFFSKFAKQTNPIQAAMENIDSLFDNKKKDPTVDINPAKSADRKCSLM